MHLDVSRYLKYNSLRHSDQRSTILSCRQLQLSGNCSQYRIIGKVCSIKTGKNQGDSIK